MLQLEPLLCGTTEHHRKRDHNESTHHHISVFQNSSVSEGTEVPGRGKCCWCIHLHTCTRRNTKKEHLAVVPKILVFWSSGSSQHATTWLGDSSGHNQTRAGHTG